MIRWAVAGSIGPEPRTVQTSLRRSCLFSGISAGGIRTAAGAVDAWAVAEDDPDVPAGTFETEVSWTEESCAEELTTEGCCTEVPCTEDSGTGDPGVPWERVQSGWASGGAARRRPR